MKTNCKLCSKEFEAKTKRSVFCSDACRVGFNRQKQSDETNEIDNAPVTQMPILKVSNTDTEQPIKDKIKTVIIVAKTPPNKTVFNESQKDKEGKEKSLADTMAKINKNYGEGSVIKLGEKPLSKPEVIPSGSISLDKALGVGGFPRGRIVEIFGQESSGKTTITLHTIAEAQKKGLKCAFVDVEQSFDSEYAFALGVDIDELILVQPQSAEEALNIAESLISSGAIGAIIIDSVAALVPKAELEGEIGESKMGLIARIMSQTCRKFTPILNSTKTLCVFINQLRQTIGPYQPSHIAPGGLALKFYASIRLEVSKKQITDGTESTGSRVKVKVIKNKVAPPFKIAEFDVMYGEGINRVGEVVDIAGEMKIIEVKGSWFSYKEHKTQGRSSFIELLHAHEILLEEIESKIYNQE